MTDSRTTELLREGLTKRDIEWRIGLEGVTFVGDWCFVEYDNGKLAATCEPVLTPEQAIAVTLGNEREQRLEGVLRDWIACDPRCTNRSCGDCEHDEDEGCALYRRMCELGAMSR